MRFAMRFVWRHGQQSCVGIAVCALRSRFPRRGRGHHLEAEDHDYDRCRASASPRGRALLGARDLGAGWSEGTKAPKAESLGCGAGAKLPVGVVEIGAADTPTFEQSGSAGRSASPCRRRSSIERQGRRSCSGGASRVPQCFHASRRAPSRGGSARDIGFLRVLQRPRTLWRSCAR